MRKCWSLYNKEEKLRIDDLRIDQVKTILLAIPTAKIGEWYACQEGDLHWQSLSDVPDFHEEAVAIKGKDPILKLTGTDGSAPARQPSPRRPLFEDVDMAGGTLEIEAVQTKERRTARRYVRNLKFKIGGDKKFSCATADISMSGVSLKDKLPPGLGKNFKAELSLEGSKIKVLCSKVSDTTVKILECDGWDVLRNWIVNW